MVAIFTTRNPYRMTFSVYSASVKSSRSGFMCSISQSLGFGPSITSASTLPVQCFFQQRRIFCNHSFFNFLSPDTHTHTHTHARTHCSITALLTNRRVYPTNTLEQVPLPFPFPLPFPLPSLPPPLPSPPLRSRSPLLRLRVWGSALAPPAGPGGARPPNGTW